MVSAPKPYLLLLRRVAMLALLVGQLSGCLGASVAVPTEFPQPLLPKIPVQMGLVLTDELTRYVHEETIPDYGEWSIDIGPAQQPMFTQLFAGMFDAYQRVASSADQGGLDGVIQPTIKEVQFSIPEQTRSDYFEVWIRYEIALIDNAQAVATLPIAAYGKANVQNYGFASTAPALQAAARAACRDAMAFFAVQFMREPAVRQWLASNAASVTPTAVPESANNSGGSS
ncbi:MAG: hypothetical protein AAF648_11640 [Pseudomonadota bacterium]